MRLIDIISRISILKTTGDRGTKKFTIIKIGR